MKTYDKILILEPEDTYNSPYDTYTYPSALCIRGGDQPLYEATMAIAKTHNGELICIKSRERIPNSYSQSELQEIVDLCENPIDMNLLLML